MVERLNGIEKVRGSIPLTSTIFVYTEGESKGKWIMELKRREFAGAMACTVAALMAGCSKKEVESAVLKDLETAFNGESNAAAKYLVYAAGCEKAGYLSLATFFKAASFAESIHAANHAKTAKKLFNVDLKAAITPAKFTDVKVAVEDAIKGETYEYMTMYPEMLVRANNEKVQAAVKTFDTARLAEIEHGRIYTEALKNLDAWKAAGRQFWVCPVCGYTADKASKKDPCPYCKVPASKYKIFG